MYQLFFTSSALYISETSVTPITTAYLSTEPHNSIQNTTKRAIQRIKKLRNHTKSEYLVLFASLSVNLLGRTLELTLRA